MDKRCMSSRGVWKQKEVFGYEYGDKRSCVWVWYNRSLSMVWYEYGMSTEGLLALVWERLLCMDMGMERGRYECGYGIIGLWALVWV